MSTTTLTYEEKETVFREMQRMYATMDAKRHLLTTFGFDDSDEDWSCETFESKVNYSLDEAIDPESKNYILDYLVEKYFDAFDCNVPENTTWECVIDDWLNSCFA